MEHRAENGNLPELELNQLTDRLTDETYDESDIGDLIDELKEDGLLISETAKLKLVYPSSHQESVESRFDHLLTYSSIFKVYVVGFITYGLLLNWDQSFDYIFGDLSGVSTQQLYFEASFLGIVASYAIGKIVLWGYGRLREHVPVIAEHRFLLYPIGVVAAGSTAVVLMFSNYTSQPITINHVLAIITVSVVGGGTLGKWFAENA